MVHLHRLFLHATAKIADKRKLSKSIVSAWLKTTLNFLLIPSILLRVRGLIFLLIRSILLRVRGLNFLLIQSMLLCVRGSRSIYEKNVGVVEDDVQLALPESMIEYQRQ